MNRFHLARPRHILLVLLLVSPFALPARAADEWEVVLREGLGSKYSEDRHLALKQVDTSSGKGLKALWGILAQRDRDLVDWYVREGAYEALLAAEGEEAEAEILKTLKSKDRKYELAKEAIVYSVIWKLRKQFVKDYGGNDDEEIAKAKYAIRKTRGLDYFELILPTIEKVDPDGKRIEWIRLAFADRSSRVRRAAINGFLSYPHESAIPLLLGNLERLAKSKRTKSAGYREWVFTRYALETLTGMYFREDVEVWRRWWNLNKDRFSIEKLVEEKKEEEEAGGRTRVVNRGGVEIRVNMKVAGEGYPLLVLPWRGYEPDYFRPYFHGIEEFMKVFYIQMPQIGDFKGLARETKSNLVLYPTELLGGGLGGPHGGR